MQNMRRPARQAPSVEEAKKRHANKCGTSKKKPPPRPPPPDRSKLKSKSAWNLNQNVENLSLIEWSPPTSPKTNRPFGGSVYSSFSSSTSSLASSKRSLEYDSGILNSNGSNASPILTNESATNARNMPAFNLSWSTKIQQHVASQNEQSTCVPQISMPTIIRAQPKPNARIRNLPSTARSPLLPVDYSPPMPSVPPPSPPKEVQEVTVPFAIALYDFPASQSNDLQLQVNNIVYLLRRVNQDWLYGRVGDREGMFPESFVDVRVPLTEGEQIVTALYEFRPQMQGDLHLRPGQRIKVLKSISNEWLFGECDGQTGQFPATYVDIISNV